MKTDKQLASELHQRLQAKVAIAYATRMVKMLQLSGQMTTIEELQKNILLLQRLLKYRRWYHKRLSIKIAHITTLTPCFY